MNINSQDPSLVGRILAGNLLDSSFPLVSHWLPCVRVFAQVCSLFRSLFPRSVFQAHCAVVEHSLVSFMVHLFRLRFVVLFHLWFTCFSYGSQSSFSYGSFVSLTVKILISLRLPVSVTVHSRVSVMVHLFQLRLIVLFHYGSPVSITVHSLVSATVHQFQLRFANSRTSSQIRIPDHSLVQHEYCIICRKFLGRCLLSCH